MKKVVSVAAGKNPVDLAAKGHLSADELAAQKAEFIRKTKEAIEYGS